MKPVIRNNLKILWLAIMVLLPLPMIQKELGVIKENALKGYAIPAEKANFSWVSWFAGDYQQQQEKYLNESFGFRSSFVRINNQLTYSLFNKAQAAGVIIGKDYYLYEENYIKAYYGTDFIGTDSIKRRIDKLRYIQDTLGKLDKQLILVFAAGKGSYYPEFFPEAYKTVKGTTNYEVHLALAEKAKLNYIDFNRYFIENKYKSPYPLYPQYGIHWSFYGQCLAADSLIRYIEALRNIDMPGIYWNRIRVEKPRQMDYDIAEGMNLIFKPKTFKMAYPELQFESPSEKTKPAALFIADSFYWGLFNFGFSDVFSESHFWFYNRQIYPDSYKTPLETSQVDLQKEISRHDVIVLLATEATLPGFGWGFIEQVHDLFSH